MVNFSPSEEQELLRQTLADFAREVLRPQLRESDEQNAVPADLPAQGMGARAGAGEHPGSVRRLRRNALRR